VEAAALTFWHVFLLFGALQSLFLAAAFGLAASDNRSANRLLSLLLLCSAALLLEYTLIDAGVYRQVPHLLGVSVPLLFTIGPLYWFYTGTLLKAGSRPQAALHYLPAVLSLALLSPFFLQQGAVKAAWMTSVLAKGFVEFPMLQLLLLSVASFSLLVYFYRAYAVLESYETTLVDEFASTAILTVNWLKRLSSAFSLFMVLFYLAWGELLFVPASGLRYRLLAVVMLALAAFVLGLGLYACLRPEMFVRYTHTGLPALGTPRVRYEKTALSGEQVRQYRSQLLAHMEQAQPFLQGELRLSALAVELGLPAHHLSQVINQEFGKNFFEFINTYRVEAAKALLRAPAAQAGTVLDIALRAGFNSKASFNRIFKQYTGLTPTAYQATAQTPPN
jgi:AraC-like DNA-binding protein